MSVQDPVLERQKVTRVLTLGNPWSATTNDFFFKIFQNRTNHLHIVLRVTFFKRFCQVIEEMDEGEIHRSHAQNLVPAKKNLHS